MRKKIYLSLITTLVSIIGVNLYSAGKVIYGSDDRKDYYEMNKSIKLLADSVVSLWDISSVSYDSLNNKYKLKTTNYGDTFNLCKDEPFRNQPIGAFCSGGLIAEDIVITAGHCIPNETKCNSTYFIFGYAVKNSQQPDEAVTEFDPSDVYRCLQIIKTQVGPEPTQNNPNGIGLGPDYAIIKLDRKVSGRTPLKINRSQKITKGEPVFVIGHPVGLPVKFADGAFVRDPSPDGYFVANLDTYGGNSGSPVFNAKTKLIEGILVRGDRDFVQTPQGCIISNVLPNNGGRGEDVTKISVLYKYLYNLIPRINHTNKEKSIDITTQNINLIENLNTQRYVNFNFEQ